MATIRQLDLVVRGGLVVDGSGGDPFMADVGVRDGRVVALGTIKTSAREEIDATGCIVTPGFVDIHTHYDGHATWTSRLSPSSAHGVTTVMLGNCGVGFAPCRPADHDVLVRLMEGVEDIPDVVLNEGLPWNWESFPEYLDALSRNNYDMDVACYLPHAPLRLFVMGERAMSHEPATPDDIARMRELVREAMGSGAFGVATSRSLAHKSSDGHVTPTYDAMEDELTGIALGLADASAGVLQFISDFERPEAEFAMVRRVIERAGRPLTFSLLQSTDNPQRWRSVLNAAEAAAASGLHVTAQVCGRPIGLLAGLHLTSHPFSYCPSYQPLKDLPFEERLAAMRSPDVRAKILSEFPADSWQPQAKLMARLDMMYVLGDPPVYEPKPEDSFAARAAAAGVGGAEYAYDLLTSGDGRTIIYIPAANYVGNSIEAIDTMIRSKVTVPGLGDGGAHCKLICDASLPTYMLTRWTGEKDGPMSLPAMVKALSADTARAVGLTDRGRIAPGLRADLNVIKLDALRLHAPELVYDLPSGGGRLDQRADGYVATVVAGTVTYRDAKPTGALPGRLVRRQETALAAAV